MRDLSRPGDVPAGGGDEPSVDDRRALGPPCYAALTLSERRVVKDPLMTRRPSELDRALEHRGLPAGNVGLLLAAAADVLAAWERAGTWEEWDAWSRSEAGADAMAELEAALETFAPAEGES